MAMTPSEFAQVQEAFLRVRGLPPESRVHELQSLTEGLRLEVASLLESEKNCGSFLELATSANQPTLSQAPNAVVGQLPAPSSPTPSSPTLPPPKFAGPYRLLQQIGEGGFGVVYMAEQLEPIRRKVAVKLVKPGMDSKQVLARFQAERQALAMMEHPSIARVFDVGTTNENAPYFVMELVRGIPIDQYCEQNDLELEQRLILFRQVCSGVHHAHRKGVIHRDLKPSNVLVASGESEPVAKVIDFGIAKALDARLTEATLFTEFGQMVGTLEYMSPEQAEMSAVDIDTRSDVYALGVLLYRLLTGVTPISKDQLLKMGVFEVPRLLRETQPPIPSSQITWQRRQSLQGQPSRQFARSESTGLRSMRRGDLDWITMKALAKDRRDRYDSSRELSEDIKRFLAGRPILAHPPSIVYQIRKFVHRHRVAVLVSLAVLASSILGIAGLVSGSREANRARAVAEKNRDEAIRARDSADRNSRALSENLYSEMVGLAWQATQANDRSRARELLDSCLPDLRGWEWDFVENEIRGLASTTFRQAGQSAITVLEIDPTNKWVGCVVENGSVELRHRRDGRLAQTIHGPFRATVIRFFADGTRMLVGTGAGDLLEYKYEKSNEPGWKKLVSRRLAVGGIYDICFSPDQSQYAVCTGGAWVKVFSSESAALVREWKLPSRISNLLFLNEATLLGAGLKGDLHQLSIEEGRHESRFISQSSLMGLCRVDELTAYVATGGAVLSVDLQTLDQEPKEVARSRGVITLLVTGPQGTALVGRGDGQLLEKVGIEPVREVAKFGVAIQAACWDSERECYWVATADGRMLPLPKTLKPQGWTTEQGVADGLVLRKQSKLATVDNNGWLAISNIKTGEVVAKKKAHDVAAWAISVDASEQILATVGEDRQLCCWEVPGLTLKFKASLAWGVRDVCVSPDGAWIAAAPPDDGLASEGMIGVWNVRSGECMQRLSGHDNWVLALAVSADGKHLISGSENRETRIWDTKNWKTRHLVFPRQHSAPEQLALEKSTLHIGHRDGWVTSWSMSDGSFVDSWPVFGDALTGLAVTPGRRLLATSRSGSRLKVRDLTRTKTVAQFELGVGYIETLTVSADGRTLAITGKSGEQIVRRLDLAK